MRKQIIQFLLNLKKFLKEKFNQYNDQLPFFITIIIALIIVVVGVNLFVDLTETLHSEILEGYDQRITEFVISFREPWLTKTFQFITDMGDQTGYIIIGGLSTIALYLYFKSWRFSIQTLIVLIIAALSNIALKNVINRARPEAEHLVSVETLSYPSGHAMSAMAFYGFLVYVCYKMRINKWLKSLFMFIFIFLILAIGISRIYLGVHFPSDIAGGYIAGFIWVIFSIILFHVIDLWRRKLKRKRKSEVENS